MLNRDKAREMLYQSINQPDESWPEKPEMIILEQYTVEKEYGWVFFWTSRPYYETGDFKYAIAGNGPAIVSRYNGSIYFCGTAPPIEDRIKEQEERLISEHGMRRE